MFCKNCGEQLPDDANVCSRCGAPVEKEQVEQTPAEKPESSVIGILAIVFGALGGLLGLIFSIVGLCTYKKPENKKKCYIGLGLFCAWTVIEVILLLI